MPPFDHFNLLASVYDRLIKPASVELMIDLADLPTTGRLLDAGGGTGRVSYPLRSQAKSVTVVDLSIGMLKQALYKDGLQIACSHTEALPFPDGSFERVIMVDAFHHVCHQEETAGELWRVTKPGGRIVIEEPDIRTNGVKVIALLEKLVLMRSHFHSPVQIANLFASDQASISHFQDGFNAFIVVEKTT